MNKIKKLVSEDHDITNEIVKRVISDNRRDINKPKSGGNDILYLGTDEDNFFKDNYSEIYDLCIQKHTAQKPHNKTLKKGEGKKIVHRIKKSLLLEIIEVMHTYLDLNKYSYHNPNFNYRRVLSEVSRLGEYLEFNSELVFIHDNHQPKPNFKWFEREKFSLLKEFFIPYITKYNIDIYENNGNFIFEWKLSFDPYILVQLLGNTAGDVPLEHILSNTSSGNETYENVIKRLVNVRKGQAKFRKELLEDSLVSFCPFTDINEPYLLVASHIKPWVACESFEQTDKFNGFLFTPTYDKLFDKGFISFTNEKQLLISPQIKKPVFDCLGLDKNFIEKLAIDGRFKYLNFHRNKIFKDSNL